MLNLFNEMLNSQCVLFLMEGKATSDQKLRGGNIVQFRLVAFGADLQGGLHVRTLIIIDIE